MICSESRRTRAEILAAIAGLPPAVQGKICKDRRTLATGKIATYHNLQFWADGKNHTVRIPEAKLQAFMEAVENGVKARRLLAELSFADSQAILAEEAC